MNEMERIHAFLVEMQRTLLFLSPRERHEILRETQSHLAERAAAGRLDEALQAMGAPEIYAEQFAEPGAGSAEAVRKLPQIPALSVSIRLGIAATAFIFAVPSLLALVMELIDPSGFGLWVSPEDGHFVFGINSTSNPKVSDVAGRLMLPASALLSFVLAASVWASVRSALLEVVRTAVR